MNKSEASKRPKCVIKKPSVSLCTKISTVLFGCVCIGLVAYGSWKDDGQKLKRNDIIHRKFINGSVEYLREEIFASLIDIKTIEEPKSIVSSSPWELNSTVSWSHKSNIRINMTGKEYCEIVDGSRTIFTDVSCDSCHVSSDERICSPCIDSFEMFVIVKSE